MSSVHHSWANAHEKHPVLRILGTKLGHDHVRGGLAHRVRATHVHLVFRNQVGVGEPRRDGNDLFLLAFENEWREQVEQMNGPDNVGLANCKYLLFQTGRVFTPLFASALGNGHCFTYEATACTYCSPKVTKWEASGRRAPTAMR